MADKKLYDSEGKQIGSTTIETAPPSKNYYDMNGSPIQLNPGGLKQGFGNELYTPQVTKEASDAAPPYVNRLISNSFPAVGSVAAGPAGTLAGTGLSELLKHMAPNLFGEPASDPGFETVQNLALNDAVPGLASAVASPTKTLTKALLGRGLGPALRKFPAVREGAVKELSQQLQGFRVDPEPLVQTIDAAKAVNTPVNAVQQNIKQLMNGIQDGTTNYKDLADKILKDVQTARQFKILTGQPKIAEQLALNKLLDLGEQGGNIDAKKILGELAGGNKELYSEAISPQTMKPFRDLLGEISNQEKHPGLDRIINYSSGKLAWALPAAAMGHSVGGVAGAVGSLALTNNMLAKIMSNPGTANLVLEAMRTPAGTAKGNLLSHALAGFLTPNRSIPANLIRGAADIATVPDR